MPQVKLLCVYHKPSVLLKSDVVTPIHAGRALLEEKVKSGVLSRAEAQWMAENLTGDDTGDNLSAQNPYLNEMTAVYWAWKNYDKLGNPDFIGLMHYRRQFWLNTDLNAADYLSAIGCDEKYLPRLLAKTPCVSLRFVTLEHAADSVEFFKSGTNNSDVLERKLQLLDKTDPSNARSYQELARQKDTGGLRNMFILPREEFFRYCEWIFALLLPLQGATAQQERLIGFAAEVLTGLYLKRLALRRPDFYQADLLDYEDLAAPATRSERSKELRRRVAAYLLPFSAKYKLRADAQRVRNRFWAKEQQKFDDWLVGARR